MSKPALFQALTPRTTRFAFFVPVLAFRLALTLIGTQAAGSRSGIKWFRGNPQPIAGWAFAQTDGDFVPDATGHGYDARIYGSTRLETRWRNYMALEFDG